MKEAIQQLYRVYGFYYFRWWCITALVAISWFTVDINYWCTALAIYFVTMPILQSINHEYICHEYITPKNRVIDFLVLFMFYSRFGESVAHKRNFHITHHRYWKEPERDPTQKKMIGQPVWRHVFGFDRPVAIELDTVKNSLLTDNRFVKLMDPYARHIHYTCILLMFIFLPWAWFVIFAVYIPWLAFIASNFHDELFHGELQTEDNSFYMPFFSNGAWHLKHHREYAYNYYGPCIIPKLNPSWYFQKLFFNQSVRSLI